MPPRWSASAADRVVALGRHRLRAVPCAAWPTGEVPWSSRVVRPRVQVEAVEAQRVAGDRDRLARLHRRMFSVCSASVRDDAEQRQPQAGMGERRAEGRARQADQPAQRHAGRDAADAGLGGEVGQCAEHQPQPPARRRGRQTRAPPTTAAATSVARQRAAEGGHQPLRRAEKVAALPGQQRAERHTSKQRQHQRREGQVEERRADRDLVAGRSPRGSADRACR